MQNEAEINSLLGQKDELEQKIEQFSVHEKSTEDHLPKLNQLKEELKALDGLYTAVLSDLTSKFKEVNEALQQFKQSSPVEQTGFQNSVSELRKLLEVLHHFINI